MAASGGWAWVMVHRGVTGVLVVALSGACRVVVVALMAAWSGVCMVVVAWCAACMVEACLA